MKKVVLAIGLVLLSIGMYAQTFVSTAPQNRNAVLEEFTGISCTFCPNGHKVSDQLAIKYPGQFIAINIHEGNFAIGQTPNFTTGFGLALANQAGVTGYPSGSVNRASQYVGRPSAISYGITGWPLMATTILAQPSYVNIAAESTIDWDSRLLTVNVEAYYTGTPSTETNNIHVALLMNNTPSKQTGGEKYPENIVITGTDTVYYHQHMLRHLLTEQWGEEIIGIAQDGFISKTYTYVIPPSLNNVNFDLGNLEVVTFISEGKGEIVTGSKSKMTHQGREGKLEPEKFLFKKLWVENTDPANMKTYSISATIRNMGEQPITSLKFMYRDVTGGSFKDFYSWTGSLGSLEEKDIQLADLTPSGFVPLDISITEVNGVLLPTPLIKSFARLGIMQPILMQEEDGKCDKKVVSGLYIHNTGIENLLSVKVFYGLTQNLDLTYTWEASAEDLALNLNRDYVKILLPEVSIEGIENPTLYARLAEINGISFSTTTFKTALTKNVYWVNEFVKINLIQDQWGSDITWTLKDPNGNVVLNGGPYEDLPEKGTKTHPAAEFSISSATEVGCYTFEIIDKAGDGVNAQGTGLYGRGKLWLSSFDSTTATSEKIFYPVGTAEVEASGYSLRGGYILAINLIPRDSVGINILPDAVQEFTIYPNPVQGNTAKINVSLKKAVTAEVVICDILGKEVLRMPAKAYTAGSHTVEIDVKNILKGMYIVRFGTTEGSVNQKLIISK